MAARETYTFNLYSGGLNDVDIRLLPWPNQEHVRMPGPSPRFRTQSAGRQLTVELHPLEELDLRARVHIGRVLGDAIRGELTVANEATVATGVWDFARRLNDAVGVQGNVFIPPGLWAYLEALLAGENQARELPPQAVPAGILADPMGDLPPAEQAELQQEEDNLFLRFFDQLRDIRGEWSEPEWLEFTAASSRWMTEDDLPAKVKQALLSRPKDFADACAYLAMAASGISQKALGDPKEWKCTTGLKIRTFLQENVAHLWQVYDITGRLVLEGGAPKRKKRTVRLVVGGGHVAAIWSRQPASSSPVQLTTSDDAPTEFLIMGRFTRYLSLVEGQDPLRSQSSLEIANFYGRSGLRAPLWREAPPPGQTRYVAGYDLTAAYPTILQDEKVILPRAEGHEQAVDYEVPVQHKINPQAFMKVRLESEAERRILGRGDTISWVWGDALARLRGPEAMVECWGVYALDNWCSGKAYVEGADARLDELVAKYAEEEGLTKQKALNQALVILSGQLEASKSSRVYAQVEMERLGLGEEEFLTERYRFPDQNGVDRELRQSFDVRDRLDIFAREAFRTTGQLVKLALYSYAGVKLAKLAQIAGSPPDRVKTDAVYWFDLPIERRALLSEHVARNPEWHSVLRDGPDALDIPNVPEATSWIDQRGAYRQTDRVVPPECPKMRKSDLKALVEAAGSGKALKRALPKRIWLSGPAGVGKTHFAKEVLVPAAKLMKLEPVFLTPTRHFADYHGWDTLQSYVGKNRSLGRVAQRAKNQMVIVDEVGLCHPSALRTLKTIEPDVLVIIGDEAQLYNVNIPRQARLLGCQQVDLELHACDRYGGDPQMHAVVSMARRFALASKGWEQKLCDPALKRALRDLGLSVRPETELVRAPGDVVLGFRHKRLAPYRDGEKKNTPEAMTVHASQGKTIEDGHIHVVDWEHHNARLVYTALTRTRSLAGVTIYTDA